MIKFYFQYKRYILSAVILITLLSSFGFPPEGFVKNFLLGLSAGTAIVLFATGLKRSVAKEKTG
jgi:hypothetical protein